MKGVSVQKLTRPRYNETWDPSKVLDFLSGFYPNSELSFEKLTKKLVVLLALTTAQRVQALYLNRLETINFLEKECRIKIPDRHKTTLDYPIVPKSLSSPCSHSSRVSKKVGGFSFTKRTIFLG